MGCFAIIARTLSQSLMLTKITISRLSFETHQGSPLAADYRCNLWVGGRERCRTMHWRLRFPAPSMRARRDRPDTGLRFREPRRLSPAPPEPPRAVRRRTMILPRTKKSSDKLSRQQMFVKNFVTRKKNSRRHLESTKKFVEAQKKLVDPPKKLVGPPKKFVEKLFLRSDKTFEILFFVENFIFSEKPLTNIL